MKEIFGVSLINYYLYGRPKEEKLGVGVERVDYTKIYVTRSRS